MNEKRVEEPNRGPVMPVPGTYLTQLVDSSIDGYVHQPREHANKQAADNYAKDLTTRRQGEVRILNEYGVLVGMWANGSQNRVPNAN